MSPRSTTPAADPQGAWMRGFMRSYRRGPVSQRLDVAASAYGLLCNLPPEAAARLLDVEEAMGYAGNDETRLESIDDDTFGA